MLHELTSESAELRSLGLEHCEYFGREKASSLSDRDVSSTEGYGTEEDPCRECGACSLDVCRHAGLHAVWRRAASS